MGDEEGDFSEEVVAGFDVLERRSEERREKLFCDVIAAWKSLPGARWRPFEGHDCRLEECDLVEILYHVVDSRPILGKGPPTRSRTLLYGCETSGCVHFCGDRCIYRPTDNECPITGVCFSVEMRHEFWKQYRGEDDDAWKLNPNYSDHRRSKFQSWDDFNIHLSGEQAASELSDLVKTRSTNGKIEAFAVAYLVCIMLLSRERFISDLEENEKRTVNMEVDMKRYIVNQEQRGGHVSMQELDRIASNHVLSRGSRQTLFLDEQKLKTLAGYYATKCVCLWSVLRTAPPQPMPVMPFRNFVMACLYFFSEGYTITIGLGYAVKPIPQDPILRTFPANPWLKYRVYPNKNEKKINDILHKSKETLRTVIRNAIVRDALSPEELRFEHMTLEDADDEHFVRLRK